MGIQQLGPEGTTCPARRIILISITNFMPAFSIASQFARVSVIRVVLFDHHSHESTEYIVSITVADLQLFKW